MCWYNMLRNVEDHYFLSLICFDAYLIYYFSIVECSQCVGDGSWTLPSFFYEIERFFVSRYVEMRTTCVKKPQIIVDVFWLES